MRYRFEITYSPKEYVKACELLKQLDLWGLEGVALQNTITFSSSKDLPIDEVKAYVRKAVEMTEGKLWKIEGGKVE